MRVVDVVLRGGELHDGSGQAPREGDLAITADRIVAVGDVGIARGRQEIDCRGLAVAPGFINMLSWATESLLVDGFAQSDIRQGVTLEVFGEGESMGPLTPLMRERMLAEQTDLRYDVEWTTLREYLDLLEARGVSPNVASFVGATTVRIHEVGHDQRPPTTAELAGMVDLVERAMQEGALGVGSSLIYAPASAAQTPELVALASSAARHGGMYISHVRSEGLELPEAIRELIEIAEAARAGAEIYHFKALGPRAESMFDEAVGLVEAARANGVAVTADLYPYAASGTGLDAAMPPWVQEGGLDAWIERLRQSSVRGRVINEMREPQPTWENHLLLAGGAEGVRLAKFKSDRLQRLAGRSLASVAVERGTSPEAAAIDLVVEDGSRVEAVYFNQSEDVVRRAITLPWVSFGSDAAAPATSDPFLRSHPHPRAYGTFARLLGRYVRDERLVPLSEAIRRLTSLPAENLGLAHRGRLLPGYFADIAALDPSQISDRSSFELPHQYAIGVRSLFVNGVATLLDGAHTGARAGRVLGFPRR